MVLTAAFPIGWGLAQLLGAVMVRRGNSLLYVIGGILAVGAGVLALAWPDMTLFVLVVFVGWSLIVWGVIDVLGGFAVWGLPYWWLYVVRGVVSVWPGFFALHREVLTIEVLTFVIGIQIIMWGVGDLMVAHLLHDAKTDWMGMKATDRRSAPAKPARKPAKRKATRR
ncbi:MAG: HdeD family acid-resistance protein [Acidimicrobiia bacterium]